MNGPLILTYHSVADPVIDPALQVHPATLSEHLRWLREAGYRFVDVADLCRTVFAGEDASNLVSLTFDDGYTDFVERALPHLSEQSIDRVTLFICPEHVGNRAHWNYRSRVTLEHLDWPCLKELSAAGVRIAAHGLSHRNFCQFSIEQLAVQLDLCQQHLAEHIGQSSELLAFPYGDYKDDHLPVVRERFEFAFAVGDGRGFTDRGAISRRCISEFTSRERLLAPLLRSKVAGASQNVLRIS